MLCADLIAVWWVDEFGETDKALANLEDISNSGACLQVDVAISEGTLLHIRHPKVEFEGRVKYCVFREIGYFVGVEFEPGFEWNEKLFEPEHLLDPRTLFGLPPKTDSKLATRKI